MPSFRHRFTALAISGVVAAVSLEAALQRSARDTLPASMSSRDFWSLIEQLSEPGGYFQSNSGSTDNLVSNENEVSFVAATVAERARPSGVYLGVGPEQNFTYIAAIQPRIAFITDIRRGNLHVHLMYKALFEMTGDRADFVARLFNRRRPAGLSTTSTAADMMQAHLAAAPVVAAEFDSNLTAIVDHLTRTRELPLSAGDVEGIGYVYRNFHRFGPSITYTSSIGGRSSGNTYASLMASTDATSTERTYLASEASFSFVKSMQARNLIVPVVGDFAGPKALRAIGSFLRDREAIVTAFYVSNVEPYLQRSGVWTAFCANVATMPIDASSLFIRSTALGAMAAETARCAARPAGRP